MKNYIVLNGRKTELSEETAKNLENSLQKEEHLMAQEGDRVSYISIHGDIIEWTPFRQRPLDPNESLNKNTLEKALKYIQFQNFADEVNEETEVGGVFFIWYDAYKDVIEINDMLEYIFDASIRFSSREAAQKAIDYFGRDWLMDYLR